MKDSSTNTGVGSDGFPSAKDFLMEMSPDQANLDLAEWRLLVADARKFVEFCSLLGRVGDNPFRLCEVQIADAVRIPGKMYDQFEMLVVDDSMDADGKAEVVCGLDLSFSRAGWIWICATCWRSQHASATVAFWAVFEAAQDRNGRLGAFLPIWMYRPCWLSALCLG